MTTDHKTALLMLAALAFAFFGGWQSRGMVDRPPASPTFIRHHADGGAGGVQERRPTRYVIHQPMGIYSLTARACFSK